MLKRTEQVCQFTHPIVMRDLRKLTFDQAHLLAIQSNMIAFHQSLQLPRETSSFI